MNRDLAAADAEAAADRVRAALRRMPAVADWWVIVEPTADRTVIVAYVVPGRPAGHAALLRGLRDACDGRWTDAVHLVRLSTLPRDADGAVDTGRLRALPVVSDETLRAAERAVRRQGALAARAAVADAPAPAPDGLVIRAGDVRHDDPPEPAGEADAPPALSIGPEPSLAPEAVRTLPQTLERAAGTGKGIVFASGTGSSRRLSYGGLLDRARRAAHGLALAGVRPGSPVMLPAGDSEDFLTAFWACQFSGAIPVPCAPDSADAGASAAEKLIGVWELLAEPPILTSDEATVPDSLTKRARLLDPRELATAEPPPAPVGIDPAAVAVMLLTSGSTGMPKLVTQTHTAILSMTAAARDTLALDGDDVSVNWFPLDHVVGLLMCHVRDVWLSCEQVHAPTDAILGEPLRWLDLLSEHRATLTWTPNFAFALINARAGELAGHSWDLSRLRSILNAGEMVVAEQVRQCLNLLAPFGLRHDAVQPAWGMSETCSVVTVSRDFSGTTTSLIGPVDVGSPYPGLSMRIVRDDGSLAREGETGDLQVTGSMVTAGYHANDTANAESFTDDGWFRTGDRALLREGALTVVGRSKDIIRVNGISIPSTEAEAIAERSDGVLDSFTAAVAYRPGSASTDGIAVFFSPRAGHETAAVAADVRRRVLDHYGFAPRQVIAVRPEEIPKTSIGKIRRALLAAALQAGDFDDRLSVGDREAAAARAGLWPARPSWAANRGEPGVRDECAAAVLAPDTATADRLRTLLAAHGRTCSVALWDGAGTDDAAAPTTPQDMRAFLTGADGQRTADEIVLAFRAPHGPPADSQDLITRQAYYVERVLLVVRALIGLRPQRPVRLGVIAPGLSPVAAGDLPDLALAPLSGMIRSLDAELGWLRPRIIDAEPGRESDAEPELVNGAHDTAVAYRRGIRRVSVLTGWSPQAVTGSSPFRVGAAYVVAGGLGGVGFEVCRHLLTTKGCSLVVLGRGALTEAGGESDARPRRLRELQRAGRVCYVRVDAGDAVAVRAAVEEAEAAWGLPVEGALHLAGATDGVEAAALDGDRVHEVLRAKTAPALTLGRLMAERGGFVVAFSSVNALFGGARVTAYAAANAFLGSWAAHLAAQGVTAHVLSWSRWQSLGMGAGADDEELVRSRGYRVLSAEEGLRAFDAALRLPPGHTVIGVDPTNPFVLSRIGAPAAPLDRPEVRCDPPPAGTGGTSVADALGRPLAFAVKADATAGQQDRAGEETLALVAGLWQDILAVPEVAHEEGFFELGAQSLHFPRAQYMIEDRLNVRVDIADFFRHPTVGALAAHVDRLRGRVDAAGKGHDEGDAHRRASADRFGRLRSARGRTGA